ncbi:Inner centromere protein-related protein pic1 [Apiospora phragmitis]|uniref:Inner centromere protein-related protein pic1 n=1 Tax=Apiospora phragmitis TaxID=2905665 RepID=A0ABR1X5Z6_9PEZI
MAGPRATRLQVGSAPWVAEERSSALQIAHDEVEEFSYSARNDFDWLNEHMADIFSENQINVAEIFKTPGKLRGKTPRTARKANPGEARVPLSNIFSATPKGAPNPFVLSKAERNHTPKVKIAADPQPAPQPSPARIDKPTSPVKDAKVISSVVDSGYHGSQSQDVMDVDYNDAESAFEEEATQPFSIAVDTQTDHEDLDPSSPEKEQEQQQSPAQHPSEPTSEPVGDEMETEYSIAQVAKVNSPPAKATHHHESTTPAGSPVQPQEEPEEEPKEEPEDQPGTSPVKSSPEKAIIPSAQQAPPAEETEPDVVDEDMDDAPPSEGSSPIRPVVRKSSLNFASLPAREPITHKSTGNRISRTSHLEQTRTSYYNRHTGGKSLGNVRHEATDDENDSDLDDEVEEVTVTKPIDSDDAVAHNKTYTQRLQDQISKLGQLQPQASRPSKSIANAVPAIQPSLPAAMTPAPQPTLKHKSILSPKTHTTPGAFPEDEVEAEAEEDDEDDPRPGMPKSHTADVMEGVSGKETIGMEDFVFPKTRQQSPQKPATLQRAATTYSHQKSASVPVLPKLDQAEDDGGELQKTNSVSNPPLATVSETEADVPSSLGSPSRPFRDSPLKQVKNKLSSILGRSKGLLVSSAASSAEGKASLLSPSTPRLGFHAGPSTMSIDQQSGREAQPLYPDLSKHASATSAVPPASPTRTEGQAKESKRLADQMDKLEKERAKEREKARVFSKEQERIAAMEKQVAAQKEKEKKAPAPPPTPTQPTRTSPRKAKEQSEEATADDEDDVDMLDAPTTTTTMPPPSVSRPVAPPSATKGREIKRPIRPTREPAGKTTQPRTMIRVNLGSQQPQFHPSSSTATPSVNEPSNPTGSQSQLKLKQSQSSLQSKSSTQNLNSSISSSGRPKALEMAERKKERDEREAQRKQEAKAEMERKKAATQEEKRRQEQQKRLEAERQKDEERRQAAAQAEAKKNAHRQAMLEKAKQTRAPPPAARSVNGQPEFRSINQNEPNRPPLRMTTHRSQEDLGRSVLQNTAKPATKRPLQQDNKEAKRMRMTSEFDDLEMEHQPSLQGLPVRPSNGLKKVTAATILPQSQKPSKPRELPAKSMFPAGYANVPQGGANRDLYKTSVTGQQVQSKTAHPLDMAQVSKGAIPFAANPNPAGPSHKTPARPMGVMGAKSVAKSATRSSPRFQNGEEIELQEIDTDEDDSDNEDRKEIFASWTDSPALREALAGQERVDPMTIFGAPAPLNMEAVFSKSKDRFHKFRARTSSANWSGPDGLTEEEIRKDLAAREKLRRDGAWSYDMGKELL